MSRYTSREHAPDTFSQTEDNPKARKWLRPEQVEAMRDAAYEGGATYLQSRNEALIVLMYDTGLRVTEAVNTTKAMLDLEEGTIFIPSEIQKDYPIEGKSPPPATITLDKYEDLRTVRTLRQYLNNRWRDSDYLFPSRQSQQMTKESVRNVVRQLALRAGVEPFRANGTRGEPDEVTPHALRHSVSWRMLAREDARLIEVRNRLRHSTIQSTERIYEHFMRR